MDFIFDAPWWLYIVPAVIGVVMAYVGLRKGDGNLRKVGIGVFAVGLAIFIASKVIETDTEKVSRQTLELVAAVEKREWDKLSALLEPGAAVSLATVEGEIYTSREQIVTACQSRVDGSKVSNLTVSGLESKRTGAAQVTTEFQLYVVAEEAGGQSVPTEWRMVWERASDGRWLVRDIVAIRIANVGASIARPWFPPAK